MRFAETLGGMLLALAFVSSLAVRAEARSETVRVDSVEGRATMTCKGREPVTLAVGTIVPAGARVRTDDEAWIALRWEDETLLRLRGGSLVELGTEGFRLLRGDSWIRVAKIGRRFEALTHNAVASVRGTCFTVSARVGTAALQGALRDRALRGSFPFAGARAVRAGGILTLDWIAALLGMRGTDAMQTTCKVFEGRVLFSPRRADGERLAGLLLRPSLVACVVGDEISRPVDMEGNDFRDQGPGFIRYPTGHDELDGRLLPTLRLRRLVERRVREAESRPPSRRRGVHTGGHGPHAVPDGDASSEGGDRESLERILDAGYEGRRGDRPREGKDRQ